MIFVVPVPPINTPRVEEEQEAKPLLADVRSPKSVAFPVVATSI
jgi:hypothetical protein